MYPTVSLLVIVVVIVKTCFYFTTPPRPAPNLPQYLAEKHRRMAIRATRQNEMRPKARAPGVISLPENQSTLPA
jgi:hypothetical protein